MVWLVLVVVVILFSVKGNLLDIDGCDGEDHYRYVDQRDGGIDLSDVVVTKSQNMRVR